MGEKRNTCRVLVERMRPVGRRRHWWEDSIKMDLREIWVDMDMINLAQDRNLWRALVNTVKNLRVPYNIGISSSYCAIGGFSRRAQLHGVTYVFSKTLYPLI
jgi:hypothetical protein